MSDVSAGTISLLFTDIEGSTRLWEQDRDQMAQALALHDRVIRDAVTHHGGTVFSTSGDGMAAAFRRAPEAVAAALDAQIALKAQHFTIPVAVRMGLHAGDVQERDGDYFGPPLNRCARLMGAAHGGQVLISAVMAFLAGDQLPAGSSLSDLGEHRLRDLSEPEHVFQLVHHQLASEFPPLRSLDSYPGNLPVPPTGFVGRELELIETAKALEASRLVTLCGVGGVGKTRLALQVAADVVPRFPDGVWLIELAGVDRPDAFEGAVAAGLGISQRPGATVAQSVTDFVREKSLLLILDNCEHLLASAARFADAVVGSAPGVRILATSREGLAVAGEQLITVPSLQLPGPDASDEATLESEAVRLFVERARESNSTFTASPTDAGAMAELCRRLDGIPLAIELAAAHVRGMTPTEITDHLDRRFRLLTRGRRTATTRHQTLRHTIDWSHDLLDEVERKVFRRTAVFAGGFSLDAAESVISDDGLDTLEVLDALLRLVDKSLILAEGRGTKTRYRLLETLRDYAWERLESSGDLEPVGQRHAQHYVGVACRAGAGLEGPDEAFWRAQVEQDLENLRAALRWAISVDDVDLALTMVNALAVTGSLWTPPFGALAREAAEMPGAVGHRYRVTALASVCLTLTQQGAVDAAVEVAAEAERLAAELNTAPEDRKVRCRMTGCLSTAIAYAGDLSRLVGMARAALADARAIDDRYEMARALIMLAGTLDIDQIDEAIAAGEEGLVLARQIGNPSYLAWAPMILAGRLTGTDLVRAEQLLTEAVEAATLAENEWAKLMAMQNLAAAQAARGEHRTAARSLLEMAHRAHAMGDHGSAQSAFVGLACLLAVLGEEDTALVIASWAAGRGYNLGESFDSASRTNYMLVVFEAASLYAAWSHQSPEGRTSYAERASALDERGILEFVLAHTRDLLGS